MKVCPKCSAKVTNDVKFCANCGENLISIEPIPDETPDPLHKMSLVLNDGVKKAKDTNCTERGRVQRDPTIPTKPNAVSSQQRLEQYGRYDSRGGAGKYKLGGCCQSQRCRHCEREKVPVFQGGR